MWECNKTIVVFLLTVLINKCAVSKLATVKSFKAENVVKLWNSLWWPIYIINSVYKTKIILSTNQ